MKRYYQQPGNPLVRSKIYLVLVHHRRPKGTKKGSFDIKCRDYKVTCIDAVNVSNILSERISVQIRADTMPKEAVIGPSEITISLVDESKDMRVFMGAITGFQLCRIYETSNVDHRRRDNDLADECPKKEPKNQQ